MPPPKVLLATSVRWPSAPRIAAAFAALGAEVEVMHPRRAVVALSRFVSRRHAYDPLRGVASLRNAMRTARPDLVVPLDDRAAHLLAALHRDSDTAALSETSLGNPAAYAGLSSRADSISAARDAGVAAAETQTVASQDDVARVLCDIGLPAVLKSDLSWGGAGVVVVHTAMEARAAYLRLAHPPSRLRSLVRIVKRRDAHFLLEALQPPVPQVSLQRFVPGTPTTTSFACWQGKVLAALHFDVIVAEGSGPACVVRRIACPQMAFAAARLAERFHLSGLHGLDSMRDREGRVHLIEINPRAPQTSHLALDVDLMAALLRAATGRDIARRPAITANDTIALFPQEWTRDPASAHLVSAHHDVPWDDPAVLRACLISADHRRERQSGQGPLPLFGAVLRP